MCWAGVGGYVSGACVYIGAEAAAARSSRTSQPGYHQPQLPPAPHTQPSLPHHFLMMVPTEQCMVRDTRLLRATIFCI